MKRDKAERESETVDGVFDVDHISLLITKHLMRSTMARNTIRSQYEQKTSNLLSKYWGAPQTLDGFLLKLILFVLGFNIQQLIKVAT